jgi:CoA:oxalate CoA-transferase
MFEKSEQRMNKPLEGIRVIDLGQIFAAPYCTLQLSYLGAEIFKIEQPHKGERLRRPDATPGSITYSFAMLNVNKKSVTLNLKDARGREILLKLLEGADILVENYTTGVMESLGLGYDRLCERFPRLIYASGKGYGSEGRWAKLSAMDTTLQAACGLVSVTGFADEPGVSNPATFIDISTGSHLTSAILAALIQRGRTGKGQKVEVSMLDVCIPSMTGLISNELEGKPHQRMGNRHRMLCPANIYPTADGEIFIYCLTETHWRTIANLMKRGDLLNLPRYKSHATRLAIADEVDGLVTEWTRAHRRDDLIQILMERGVPCGPVRSVAEVVADPEVARRKMLMDSYYPTRGKIRVLGSPLKLSAGDYGSVPEQPAPALGEHTAEVLAAIGINAAELERLHTGGVI